MATRRSQAASLALLLLAGCASGAVGPVAPGTARASPAQAASSAPIQVDRADATARDASDADRAMDAAVAAADVEAFAGHVAEDGIFFGGRGAAVGRAAVALSWAPFFAEGGPRLTWAPDRAMAAASGDLAFTWGLGRYTPRGGGPPIEARYLTAWQRGPDGLLRVALDGADEPLPDLPPGVTLRPLRTLFSADGTLLAEAGLVVDGVREAGHYLRLSRREGSGFTALSETGAFRPAP